MCPFALKGEIMRHILLLVLFAFAFVGQTIAQEDITGRPAIPLNVRSEPTLESEIISVLYRQNRVTIIGRSDFDLSQICPQEGFRLDEWLYVDLQGIKGWVIRCGMVVFGELSELPVLGSDGRVVVKASDSDDLDRRRKYIGIRAPRFGDSPYPIGQSRGIVNVREAPRLDAEILFIMGSGSTFFVVEESEDGAWYQIQWSSDTRRRNAEMETGWVARHLVAIRRWI
jgi:hypothetical protein